jgi:hypothetical protein
LDVPAFLRQLAPEMLQGLLLTVETTKSDNLKTAIQQDILDRAGYGKVSKAVHVHAPMDHNTTRQELIALVKSKAREAGVQIGNKYENTVIDVDAGGVPIPTGVTADGESKQIRSEDDQLAQDDSNKNLRDL